MEPEYALIGHPLGHSLSPQLHQRLFRLAGRPGSYRLLDLPPEEFSAGSTAARLRALAGFNVTIPYKTAVIPLLDGLDDEARFYGAVNTVACRNGRLLGSNTDAAGFVQALRQAGAEEALTGRVCVAGAGGAARALALEAARRGGQVTLAVRPTSRQRASDLCRQMAQRGLPPAQVCAAEALGGGWDLLANATPAGMFPNTGTMAVPPGAFEGSQVVFDAVYNPAETLFLRTARGCGCRCVGGMAMLAWQSAIAHRFWNGDEYDPAAVAALAGELCAVLEAPARQLTKEDSLH